jgi:hypothetical protein
MLLYGYALSLAALAAQLVLAGLARRHPTRGAVARGSLAIGLAAVASVSASGIENVTWLTAEPHLRALEVPCFGVALLGALVLLRTVRAPLAADRS